MSYSLWQSYKDCPYKVYLNKVKGLQGPTTPALENGTRVHKLLQDNAWPVTLDSRDPSSEPLMSPEDMNLVLNARGFISTYCKDPSHLIQEEYMYLNNRLQFCEKPGSWFTCGIDAHNCYDFFVDWKTGKSIPKDHQLDMYAVLFWLKYIREADANRTFKGYYFFPETNKHIEYVYDPKTIQSLYEWFVDVFEKLYQRLSSKTTDPDSWASTNTSSTCRLCGFKSVCDRVLK